METAGAATTSGLGGALLGIGAALVPSGLALAWILRHEPGRRRRLAFAGALAGGAAAGAVVHGALGVAQTFLGLDPRATPDDLVALAFGFLLAAPLEQAVLAATTLPALRSRHNDGEATAMRLVLVTALGLLIAKAGFLGAARPLSALLAARVLVLVVGQSALASMWGFVLAVTRRRTLGGSGFAGAFLSAVVFGAALDHLLFLRGDAALVAAVPLATLAASVAAYLGRDVARRTTSEPRRRRRAFRVDAPTLANLRDALRRSERPVLVGWIGFGTLVTIGVVTASFAGAIALGHVVGVDFAAVDRGSGIDTAPPLVLLGGGLLAGFPVAGYLIARASRAATVLEPALAAGIAILLLAILLGAAAPVALVFAIAAAPIAFALACVGAWIGLAPR